MAYNIKMDGPASEEAKKDIEMMIAAALDKLSTARSIDEINDVRKLIGKKELEMKTHKIDKRAKLYYSARAYLKMMALVLYNHEEVGWHATVKRGEADNEFFVKDVLVFPQIVDPTNVDVDDLEYDKWQWWALEPEQFEAMKFHGHSHVNMGVHPSGKDDAYRKKIIEQLPDDSFYIFSIWNKKFDMEVTIYDKANNIVYESEDVDWDISVEGETIGKFLDETKDRIKHRKMEKKDTFEYINPCNNKTSRDRDKWDKLDEIKILKGEA